MDERHRRRDGLAQLALGITAGRLDRRQFTRRALALGVSLPAIATMLRTYEAGARRFQEPGEGNPITVTVGGTPIAVTEEDLAGATPGGVFRFARAEDSSNLDPVTNDGNVNIWLFMNIYDQLIRVGRDGISLEPGLAESWDISEDGLTYTFNLRPDVIFSDGTPMTASDVRWSWERAANDPNQTWTFTLTALQRDADGQVMGIETPDDSTVVVELGQPWAPFLSDVAMFNMSVISEAFASGNEERLTEECMGTGPFALGEWRRGEYVRLTKNPHYWDEGLPFLDEVMIPLVPDDNARILQLQGGEIDGMYNVPSSRVPELKQDPNLKVFEFPSTYSQYIVLNHRVEPLDDPNVRLALNYATDKQTLIDVVLFGVGVEATSFMPRGALFWNDTLTGFPYDVARAQELMAQSTAPDGFTIELMTLAGSADDETLATALKDMWSQIGVDVQILPVESTVAFERYLAFDFQSWVIYWTNDIVDPDQLVAYAILPESSEAFGTGWVNPEAQELARQGAAELDPARRQEIYFQIQEIYNQDAPMVLLYHKPYVDITTTRVHNHHHPPTGQWDWKRTWIEQ